MHLQGEVRGRVLEHQADLRAVLVQIVQPEQHRRGDVREAVRRQILRPHEKDAVPLPDARQAKDVDGDGKGRAGQHADDALGRGEERVADVREGDHDAQKNDGGLPRGVGALQGDAGIERQHDAEGHGDVQRQQMLAHRGKLHHHQQKGQSPEGADHRAGKAAEGVPARVAHIGLHAEDGGDGGLGRDLPAAKAAQVVDQQAQEHGHGGLDDALPDGGQVKALFGLRIKIAGHIGFPF